MPDLAITFKQTKHRHGWSQRSRSQLNLCLVYSITPVSSSVRNCGCVYVGTCGDVQLPLLQYTVGAWSEILHPHTVNSAHDSDDVRPPIWQTRHDASDRNGHQGQHNEWSVVNTLTLFAKVLLWICRTLSCLCIHRTVYRLCPITWQLQEGSLRRLKPKPKVDLVHAAESEAHASLEYAVHSSILGICYWLCPFMMTLSHCSIYSMKHILSTSRILVL